MSTGISTLALEIAAAVADKMETRGVVKRVLTLEEACEYTGLSADTIRRLVAGGKMPVIRVDRRQRFDKKALDRWIEQHSKYED